MNKLLTTVAAIGLLLAKNAVDAQTVYQVSDPTEPLGIDEVKNVQFVRFTPPPDGQGGPPLHQLSVSMDGIKVFGNSGRPTIGQLGFSSPIAGFTNVLTAEVGMYDGVFTGDNGSEEGRNAILVQSSGASGDIFDIAIVFDINSVTQDYSDVFVVLNPVGGSFTIDSAINAVNTGPILPAPTIPEPSSTLLLLCGAMGVLSRRRRS